MKIRHWSKLPEQPALRRGDCQVWLAWLDEENPDDFRVLLSDDENIRAGRLRGLQIADKFMITHGILRILIGRYLSRKPEELVFKYGQNGKPALADNLQEGLSFNISHSSNLAVFAIAKGLEIGVDIEEVHPINDLEATASIILSEEELSKFKALPGGKKLEHFFTIWTCKEAVLKAIGAGFTSPVKDILEPLFQPGLKAKRLILLNPADGYKGALACL
jgi:4'-phosphopantetheinyl transferase